MKTWRGAIGSEPMAWVPPVSRRDGLCPARDQGLCCTRPAGHGGRHLAGGMPREGKGVPVFAVWEAAS